MIQVYYTGGMVKKKSITIDDLAAMVKTGFDAVDTRFDAVDARFNAMDARFDAMDTRFDAMDTRFGGVEKHLLILESDISYLKVRINEIERKMDQTEEILEEHSEEFRFIHKKIYEWTDPRSKKRLVTYDEFTELESRITELEKKVGFKK